MKKAQLDKLIINELYSKKIEYEKRIKEIEKKINKVEDKQEKEKLIDGLDWLKKQIEELEEFVVSYKKASV